MELTTLNLKVLGQRVKVLNFPFEFDEVYGVTYDIQNMLMLEDFIRNSEQRVKEVDFEKVKENYQGTSIAEILEKNKKKVILLNKPKKMSLDEAVDLYGNGHYVVRTTPGEVDTSYVSEFIYFLKGRRGVYMDIREMDRLVCEKVLGFNWDDKFEVWNSGNDYIAKKMFSPTSNPEHTLMLLHELKKKYKVQITLQKESVWEVELINYQTKEYFSSKELYFGLAVCRVALKSVSMDEVFESILQAIKMLKDEVDIEVIAKETKLNHDYIKILKQKI
ncbi:hypothetical protein B4U37_01730 [Sutcliffiella horikoshii]|uniref:Uncharacterized protein n=1 Tax=Sutcliffiella horikoshii TaxID=79883 RepID=A0ABM6KEW8_9BACI|nr:hypothetical protein [Sutcliffiella horikoshii]ART74845.1 hypothetical protein B4U37_01730 [Sutcliffiella horikoshii]